MELNRVYEKDNYKVVYFFVKRLVDILLSFIGIVVLIPLFIIVSIIIKFESKGPILFKQKRYGKDKKVFYIYKFRTMRVDAPANVPTKNMNNSNKYITRSGAILRKTSIDELPQLYNVLLGDMSLIGPRPVVLKEKKLIIERDKYMANNIKPGITGWAQVNGRDRLSTVEKAILDGYYVSNIGIWMDIKCIIKTIWYVVTSHGIVEGKEDINIKHI